MTVLTHGKQHGRLADPGMDLRSDPRTDPRLLAALAGFEGLYEALPNALPGDADNVTHTTETVEGPDGNDITLHIYRPDGLTGPLPGLVYVHGGGMTILEAYNKVHRRWSQDLAATGMVVVGVDFRNAYTAAALHPFPAGLRDCSSALAWIHAHREQLGITKVVLQGESGGANLALATTLQAKRDGRLDSIDGVYAMVPYISGAYGWDHARKLQELPSLVENDGYFLNCEAMDTLVAVYDRDGANAENPLCWPYFATKKDLEGLPPHVVSVNELDPLRDEGLAYYRKLNQAGVQVNGRVHLGMTHGADSIFRVAVAPVYQSTVTDIKRFADSL